MARRGVDGEFIDEHLEAGDEHNCGTQHLRGMARGNLGEDGDGNVRFCPVCRPSTAPNRRKQVGAWDYATAP